MANTSTSDKQTTKGLYIKTHGCQMNVYDSTKMADLLRPHGFKMVEKLDEADMVILNTCNIREKASEKVYSELGRIAIVKRARQDLGQETTVVVAGCVAQAEGDEVVRRAPIVDIVVGPQSYHHLPVLIEEAKRRNSWVVNLDFEENTKFDHIAPELGSYSPSAFLSIQEGCDKFCHFCCVPYTRGAEFSRPVADIYREGLLMAGRGTKEITLLGQNVSAYHAPAPDNLSAKPWALGDLLRHMAAIPGIRRLRYTTSHPMDMRDNQELLRVHAEEPKIMPYLHLPVQSGSNRILEAMNRKHGMDFYLEVIASFRQARPDIAFSSDFIVGYPGESDEDFAATLELVRRVGYAQAYSFKYSPRPGTPAAALAQQVPESIKASRLQILQKLLFEQQLEFNLSKLGEKMEILLEKPGNKPGQLIGKSPYMQSVVCQADPSLIGSLVEVVITGAGQNSLAGNILN